MLTLGVDAHKKVHVAVAVDATGRSVAHWQGPNTLAAWQELAAWAAALSPARHWGIEGAGSYGHGLAQHLVRAGETVYEVNSRLTAQGRRTARRPDKSDRLDAQAVARAVLREAPALPPVLPEDSTAVADILRTERDAAQAEATRLRNQLHALLLLLDPTYKRLFRRLDTRAALTALAGYQAPHPSPAHTARAAAVRRLAARLRLVQEQITLLTQELQALAATHFRPLTALCGVDLLTAGVVAGLLGPQGRFATEAQLAAYAGVAPVAASSAGRVRHRLNRGGNRRLNAVLYWIALTQLRRSAAAQAYVARRMAQGRTWREAVRALKRFLVRAVWRLWLQCAPPTPPPLT